jgi:hypothetical protein
MAILECRKLYLNWKYQIFMTKPKKFYRNMKVMTKIFEKRKLINYLKLLWLIDILELIAIIKICIFYISMLECFITLKIKIWKPLLNYHNLI